MIPSRLAAPAVFEGPAGPDQRAPLLGLLDVVEGQHVNVVGVQRGQDRAELDGRVGGRAGAELDADDDRLAPRSECRDRVAHRVGSARLVGEARPVEEVHATLDGMEHVVRRDGRRRPSPRGQSEPADRLAEGRGRATRKELSRGTGPRAGSETRSDAGPSSASIVVVLPRPSLARCSRTSAASHDHTLSQESGTNAIVSALHDLTDATPAIGFVRVRSVVPRRLPPKKRLAADRRLDTKAARPTVLLISLTLPVGPMVSIAPAEGVAASVHVLEASMNKQRSRRRGPGRTDGGERRRRERVGRDSSRRRRYSPAVEDLEGRQLLSAFAEYPIPLNNSDPGDLTVGPDGNLWFPYGNSYNGTGDGIGRITPSGTVTLFPDLRGPAGRSDGRLRRQPLVPGLTGYRPNHAVGEHYRVLAALGQSRDRQAHARPRRQPLVPRAVRIRERDRPDHDLGGRHLVPAPRCQQQSGRSDGRPLRQPLVPLSRESFQPYGLRDRPDHHLGRHRGVPSAFVRLPVQSRPG